MVLREFVHYLFCNEGSLIGFKYYKAAVRSSSITHKNPDQKSQAEILLLRKIKTIFSTSFGMNCLLRFNISR